LVNILKKFSAEFGDSLAKLGVPVDRINRNIEHTIKDQTTKIAAALDAVLARIQEGRSL
jgi:hypothetical protein